MFLFVGQSRAQSIVTVPLLPQFPRDFDRWLVAALKLGETKNFVHVVGEIRRQVEVGGVALDQHRDRLGRHRDALKPEVLAQKRGHRLLAHLLKLADLPVRTLREASGPVRYHLHGFFFRFTSRRNAFQPAASSWALLTVIALRSAGNRPARK